MTAARSRSCAGPAPNGDGWVANPASDPNGAGARDLGGAHRDARVGAGGWRKATHPEVSPDGRFVLYVKDGQIYRARVSQTPAATTPMDKGEKPFIKAWGRNSGPKWSPDGTQDRVLEQSQRPQLHRDVRREDAVA